MRTGSRVVDAVLVAEELSGRPLRRWSAVSGAVDSLAAQLAQSALQARHAIVHLVRQPVPLAAFLGVRLGRGRRWTTMTVGAAASQPVLALAHVSSIPDGHRRAPL